MSQHVTPGDLAGTISATKGRVSRLERELANLQRSSKPAVQQIIPGAIITEILEPIDHDQLVALAWHPTGASLVGVSLLAFPLVPDDPPPTSATISLWRLNSTFEPLNGVGGDPIQLLPYSTWREVTRIETARSWVPGGQLLVLSMTVEDNPVNFWGALFEFDTGPRQPSA